MFTSTRTALSIALACLLSANAPAAAGPPNASTSETGDAVAAFQSREAPALARAGAYAIGTKVITVKVPDRPVISAAGMSSEPHDLPVRLYYPASPGSGARAVYRHTITLPGGPPLTVSERGLAVDGAMVLKGHVFPLVVVSHGLGGWATHFSRICELIASHGYVVAALDHEDRHFDTVPEFLASFASVMLDRPVDQRVAIASLEAMARAQTGALSAVDPAAPIALIGYSMGGYGAIGTAGAAYDPTAKPFAAFPAATRATIAATDKTIAGKIGALVLMAPWGAQPDNRVWSGNAVASIAAPTLLIDGDRDQAVNYREGVRWLFDSMTGTDRRLLTLREAGHNIAGNAVALPPDARADVIGWFREPVWRQERLNQMTAHFIVAFLDATLGHRTEAQAYLDVPTRDSNDGVWPIKFGEQTGGTLSGPAQPDYWRGFARGWAFGMTLEHKAKGE